MRLASELRARVVAPGRACQDRAQQSFGFYFERRTRSPLRESTASTEARAESSPYAIGVGGTESTESEGASSIPCGLPKSGPDPVVASESRLTDGKRRLMLSTPGNGAELVTRSRLPARSRARSVTSPPPGKAKI